MSESHRIYPNAEILSAPVCTNIPCVVEGCNKIFPHSQALKFHIIKSHKILQTTNDQLFYQHRKQESENQIFFCPQTSCEFNKRGFSAIKLLREHFLRQHTIRNFNCDKCGCNFSLLRDKNRHMQSCTKQENKIIFGDRKNDNINNIFYPLLATNSSANETIMNSSQSLPNISNNITISKNFISNNQINCNSTSNNISPYIQLVYTNNTNKLKNENSLTSDLKGLIPVKINKEIGPLTDLSLDSNFSNNTINTNKQCKNINIPISNMFKKSSNIKVVKVINKKDALKSQLGSDISLIGGNHAITNTSNHIQFNLSNGIMSNVTNSIASINASSFNDIPKQILSYSDNSNKISKDAFYSTIPISDPNFNQCNFSQTLISMSSTNSYEYENKPSNNIINKVNQCESSPKNTNQIIFLNSQNIISSDQNSMQQDTNFNTYFTTNSLNNVVSFSSPQSGSHLMDNVVHQITTSSGKTLVRRITDEPKISINNSTIETDISTSNCVIDVVASNSVTNITASNNISDITVLNNVTNISTSNNDVAIASSNNAITINDNAKFIEPTNNAIVTSYNILNDIHTANIMYKCINDLLIQSIQKPKFKFKQGIKKDIVKKKDRINKTYDNNSNHLERKILPKTANKNKINDIISQQTIYIVFDSCALNDGKKHQNNKRPSKKKKVPTATLR